MIEVEVKVLVKSIKEIEEKLQRAGFKTGKCVKESDIYFDNAECKIKSNDQALRIRSCEDPATREWSHYMTFKGPKMDEISMTRKELEMQVASAEVGKEILYALGYTQVYPVIKHRQHYRKNQMTACLDRVERLGDFLELEIVVNEADEKSHALNYLIDMLKLLGYEPEAVIRESYLSMIQAKNEAVSE